MPRPSSWNVKKSEDTRCEIHLSAEELGQPDTVSLPKAPRREIHMNAYDLGEPDVLAVDKDY